ncbi:hypothetical protein EDB83DRAFT_2535700 [Lactarius deliciosus]|nr:hypothetical protein EDB83DRAFT_2535700 [Lactarius deliciosus]
MTYTDMKTVTEHYKSILLTSRKLESTATIDPRGSPPTLKPKSGKPQIAQEAQLVLLLGSPVHTFVDDAFAARTALPHDVALGDTFHFTLGADPATCIRYVRTSCPLDTAAHVFSEQWASTVFTSHTTITNSHPFVLCNAVPISEGGERVNVVLRHPAVLADLEQDNELEVREEAKEVGDGGEERRAAPRWKVRWCKRLWEGGGSRDS